MLIQKQIIPICKFIFHIVVIWLYICVNQNICSASTAQINNLSEDNTSISAPEHPQYMKTTWIHRKEYIADLVLQENEKKKLVPMIIQKLNEQVMPIYEEVQNLHMLHSLYANKPRALAIIKSYFDISKESLEKVLQPAILAKKSIMPLLNKSAQIENIIAKSVPDDQQMDAGKAASLKIVKQVKRSLNIRLKQLDKSLGLSTALEKDIVDTLEKINVQLPYLWYKHYLSPPIDYLKKGEWYNLPLSINNALQQYYLRLPMEIPLSFRAWMEYCKYFFLILSFGGLLGLYFNHYLKKLNADLYFSNIFKASILLIYCGITLVISAVIIEDNYYGSVIFLVGNLIMIIGQVLLAWDLRRIEENKASSSPLLSILPLTIIGYLIIYPGLPPLFLTIIWFVSICILLVYRHIKPHHPKLAPLERYILITESITLWISLGLVLLGLIQLAIIVYLIVIGFCIAIQLSVGCMQRIHAISNSLPQETSRAIMNSLIIAVAAPLSIALVFACFALWIITLPGGVILISHYSVLSFKIGDTQFNLIKILLFISTFYLARAIISIGTSFLHKMKDRKFTVDDSIIPPLQTALTYIVWGGYFLLVLYSLGMSWRSLAVVAGGLSVGVGFGLQSIVNNFLSGLILIFSRSLQEKDVIEVGGYTGTVQKINIRATTIETFDNAMIYVPNSQFISSILINWTRNSRSRRSNIVIGVAYDSNVELVTNLLLEAAKHLEAILKYPVPTVQFTDFANSTLNFTLHFWVIDYIEMLKTKSALRIEINELFKENNINIAYPQLDLHIKDSTIFENMPSQVPASKPHIQSSSPLSLNKVDTNK